MKSLITGSFIFIFLTAFCYQTSLTKFASLTCTLESNKTRYKVGEIPDLKVEILNKTNKDIYLIGSLDGSDLKWRMPYCFFTIEKPHPDTTQFGRCRYMNPLRKDDFVFVKAGEKFNPYLSVDYYGFFKDYSITNSEAFKNPGIYKIQFHYSTNTQDISKFLGVTLFNQDKTDSLEISSLLKKVPRVDLMSNEIEITIEE